MTIADPLCFYWNIWARDRALSDCFLVAMGLSKNSNKMPRLFSGTLLVSSLSSEETFSIYSYNCEKVNGLSLGGVKCFGSSGIHAFFGFFSSGIFAFFYGWGELFKL